jgi:hypothetical protein
VLRQIAKRSGFDIRRRLSFTLSLLGFNRGKELGLFTLELGHDLSFFTLTLSLCCCYGRLRGSTVSQRQRR